MHQDDAGIAEAFICVVELIREAGMEDYRLDEVERPCRYPAALKRLTGCREEGPIDFSGGELPGRKIDGRR